MCSPRMVCAGEVKRISQPLKCCGDDRKTTVPAICINDISANGKLPRRIHFDADLNPFVAAVAEEEKEEPDDAFHEDDVLDLDNAEPEDPDQKDREECPDAPVCGSCNVEIVFRVAGTAKRAAQDPAEHLRRLQEGDNPETGSRKLNDFRIVESTINLAQVLGLQTVVEGVETAEEARRVTQIGCDYIQGYFYSRPLRREEFEEYLERDYGSREENESEGDVQ